MKHTLHTCSCYKEGCSICDGGLAQCEVCGGAEGSLPTDCPGVSLTGGQHDAIYAGILDYKNGKWWEIVEVGTRDATVAYIQDQVDRWLRSCMGDDVADNLEERYLRVTEEFAELMYACGAPLHTVSQVLYAVYDKENLKDTPGIISEECADLMTCLAALATTHKVNLGEETKRILVRNWENRDLIREKHKQKKHKSNATLKASR